MIKNDIVCWWSGGITSAVACKLAIDLFGKKRCKIIMIDTKNEDRDTYRFKKDCEKWYKLPIEIITAIDNEYESIEDVWIKYKSLNVSTGAICSTELKRKVREKWQLTNTYNHQIFGFEFLKKEFIRAIGLNINHPKAKGIFPLLMMGLDKDDCVEIVKNAKIRIPRTYELGFKNNNCFGTGCVQGGIGYWQKMQQEFPDKFEKMANLEHLLTNLKGRPVTMLKDQSESAKQNGNILVFLKKHLDYPQMKCIDDMPKCKVEPLFDCNGFCGINDLSKRNPTELEINFDDGGLW